MDKVIIKKFMSDKLYEGLKKIKDINICGFTDKNPELWGMMEEEHPIYSIFQVAKLYRKGQINKVVFASDIEMDLLNKMIKEIGNMGISKEDIWIAKPEFYEEPLKEHLCLYEQYRRLPYLEFHVVDHCNLNCKGCVHFSPLVKTKKFADFEIVKRDFLQLKKLVSYIDKIHILGGEPLLNEELDEYLYLVRDVYPYSEISVVTNGLLLSQMQKKVVDALKDTGAQIRISMYPPILNRIDEVVANVKKEGVKIYCSDVIHEFSYTFDNNGGHARGVQKIYCRCPNLYEGHLAVCPPIAYMKYFNDSFEQNWEYQDGLIDIYDSKLTYASLLEELHKVRGVCDNCLFISKEDAIPMKWEQSTQMDIREYVWMGGKLN